jgi:Flp pilus assembly protein TadG
MTGTARRTRRDGRGHRSRGQALAEFALAAPILFVLLLGIIEAGRFIYHYETLNNATRAGVRYAIVHGASSGDATGPPDDPTGADIKQAVSDATFGLLGVGDLTIPDPVYGTGINCSGCNKRGTPVTVSVTFTYPPIVPVLPSITIAAESTGVVNN